MDHQPRMGSRLMTVPGIDVTVAMAVVATVGDSDP